MVLAEVWEGERENQHKMMRMNVATRRLLTTTVIVGGAGRVLAAQSEEHRLGMKK